MGESSKWRSLYNQDGLRRRYMSLLVPALARVHANHPHRSAQLERARAVRRAADTCLVQALATANTHHVDHHLHQRVRAADQTCVSSGTSAASNPSALKLRKAAAVRRRSSSCRLQALIMRGKVNRARGNTLKLRVRSCDKRKIAAHAADYCGSLKRSQRNGGRVSEEASDMEGWMPAESELRRLQSVMFPRKNKKITDDKTAGDNEDGCSSARVGNPAALLSQAAHYIIALQVQVEALRSLANLSVE